MKILITCALPVEFNQARNCLGLKEITEKKDKIRVAERDEITLISTGIGKLKSLLGVISHLIDNNFDLVIDSGTCGSLVSNLSELDIISSNSVIDFYSTKIKGETYLSHINQEISDIFFDNRLSNVITASIERTITTKQERVTLIEQGVSVVNWESSAIFSACIKYGVPVISIRVITDMCNENTFKDFRNNKQEACKKLYNHIKILCIGI